MRQINNFISSLLCSINHQQNQVAYIHTLLGLLQQKRHKFEKSENTTGYSAIKVGWHTNPLGAFETFARANHSPSTLTLQVNQGVQEFDGQEFQSLI